MEIKNMKEENKTNSNLPSKKEIKLILLALGFFGMFLLGLYQTQIATLLNSVQVSLSNVLMVVIPISLGIGALLKYVELK